MSRIKKIPPEESSGELKNIYDRLHLPYNKINSFITSQSLRPKSLESFLSFSENTVLLKSNKLPDWFIEAIGMYVGYLNACEYFIEHHYRRIKDLIPVKSRIEKIRSALAEDSPESVFDVWEQAIMSYTKALTKTPASITNENIEELRLCGLDDEEILEVTQFVSYFNYTNRIALGLGINIEDNI